MQRALRTCCDGNKEPRLTWNRVGVFSTLTNSFALVAVGASENFYRYASAAQRCTAGK